jgi:hydrogenase expression/formation protein HypE
VSVSSREERILGIIETARAKRPRFKEPAITMAHGAGGKATQTLIEGLLAPAFGMTELDDAGVAGEVLVTTDSFVVKPLRFPGGSIGELAVNGTVNDLAVAGAEPLALTVAMILEEGLDSDVLRAEVEAIAAATARRAWRSSPATPRSSSAATPTRCTSRPPASAAPIRGRG